MSGRGSVSLLLKKYIKNLKIAYAEFQKHARGSGRMMTSAGIHMTPKMGAPRLNEDTARTTALPTWGLVQTAMRIRQDFTPSH